MSIYLVVSILSTVKHFNYAWKDMTAPTISLMMDIVQVAMAELSSRGKIAVHCHAGFGRTGLTIACVLIAYSGMSGESAIQLVREKRSGLRLLPTVFVLT